MQGDCSSRSIGLWLEDGAAQKGLLSHAEKCSGLRRPWLATMVLLHADGPPPPSREQGAETREWSRVLYTNRSSPP